MIKKKKFGGSSKISLRKFKTDKEKKRLYGYKERGGYLSRSDKEI